MRHALTAALLATSMFSLPTAAHAQAMTAQEAAQLRAELAALKAQVQTLETRLDAATAQPAPAPDPTPTPTLAQPSVTAKPATEISWKGAPEIKTVDGWSFKPRGRMQLDLAGVDAPGNVLNEHGGVRTEFRRIYLGVDGKIPGGFSYRVEANFADNEVEMTDVYLTYEQGPWSVTAGQIKPFWSLDELTSDLFTSFTERAAFTQAFGFERRVGLSTQYKGEQLLLQAGIFGDNIEKLANDTSNAIGVDGRIVWMPEWGGTKLHLGGSVHWRDTNIPPLVNRLPPVGTPSYSARPFVHTTDVRLVSAGVAAVSNELGTGIEAAVISGPFHAAAEAYWWRVNYAPSSLNNFFVDYPTSTYFGGYAEAGMVLTPGDRRGYKDGVFERLKPSNPVTAGGIGAIEVNARYDRLDLNSAKLIEAENIRGGIQKTALIGLVWAPVDYIRITANAGKIWLKDSRVPTETGDRDYSVNTFGLRTQIDF